MSEPIDTSCSPDPVAVVMAAGKGTRMRSDLPKVVHEVAGRPMVCHVVDACFRAGCSRVIAVVGYEQQRVRDALQGFGDRVRYAVQAKSLPSFMATRRTQSASPWKPPRLLKLFISLEFSAGF